MDNIILKGMLQEFAQRHELTGEQPDRQFEKFANFCLLKTDHYDSFEFEKVGTGNCLGVDGIAIVLNGVIVNELEDAQSFTKQQFTAKFIFCQAKTSTSFDLGDFLKFITTIQVFFGTDKSAVPPELHDAFDIKTLVYERASKLRTLPQVELAYVYAGTFMLGGTQLEKHIDAEVTKLRQMPYLFSEVTRHIHDGDSVARLYRETQNDIHKDVSFQRHVSLPPMQGAKTAYLGVVRCKDYVSMIQKENGELNRGLFFENVRDFLGDQNPVNEEIAKTVNDPDERDRFAILNNGVTLVARSVTPSGDTFQVSRFQVVNGCQTSHVLFSNRLVLTDDMYITVKLIETADVDLSGKIIATTNSQSQVTKEAFATIRPYHRDLEDFFSAMRSAGFRYFYERRPHQFDNREDVVQADIVSAPSLIKSFVSVVLEEPQKVHYYYGRLLNEYNSNASSELFSSDDYPGLYFASHHLTTKVRTKVSKSSDLREWGFHIALLIKRLVVPELQKGAQIKDKTFLEILKKIDERFEWAFDIAARCILAQRLARNDNRLPEITERLLDALRSVPRSGSSLASTRAQNDVTNLRLRDGNYVGILASIDVKAQSMSVKYGPYNITGRGADLRALDSKVGDRVPFTVHSGVVTVFGQAKS